MEYSSINEVWEDFELNTESISEKEEFTNNLNLNLPEKNNSNEKIELLERKLEHFTEINKKLSKQIDNLSKEVKKDNLKVNEEKKEEIVLTKQNNQNNNSIDNLINNNRDLIIIVLLIICIHFILKTLKILKSLNNNNY